MESIGPIEFRIEGQSVSLDHGPALAGPMLPSHSKFTALARPGIHRDGTPPVSFAAVPGKDVVLLQIENGPTLVLHPHDARDLLAEPVAAVRGGAPVTQVTVTRNLPWTGENTQSRRGIIADTAGACLEWIGIVRLRHQAATSAADALARIIDSRIEEGVFELAKDAPSSPLEYALRQGAGIPAPADGGPLLVLIHGTFVDTARTFGKLWSEHHDIVTNLFSSYQGRVFALEHATIGVSPIRNALTLVRHLPHRARLHLLSHSRGGLVAEILVRANATRSVTEDEAAFGSAEYSQHRDDLRELKKLLREREISIERVVRVACPARGTLLASRRLDAYISILQWTLRLAHIPVAPELVGFLYEVARSRSDPRRMPGLEAMLPESPVIAWLNAPMSAVASDLLVIAGDTEAEACDLGSWVKKLAGDAFFWTDNDLVVQTRSMYGGTPRLRSDHGNARFFLARDRDTSHFNYFSGKTTASEMAKALLGKANENWNVIGPLSWSGVDPSGLREAKAASARTAAAARPPAERPAVIVVPDFLGSHLENYKGVRIWLTANSLCNPAALAYEKPRARSSYQPKHELIGTNYAELIERLGETCEVVPFPYDWRMPMEEEAARLAGIVLKELDLRSSSMRPVLILAHGMGGMLARVMRLERPAAWNRMMAREGARLLMLGTPNGGCWTPMQVLTGDETFGNTLAVAGPLFEDKELRRVFAGMPGFLQLQAGLLDPALGLAQEKTWRRLYEDDRDAMRRITQWHVPVEWGLPTQAVLAQAAALRARLDADLPALGAEGDKIVMVVGTAADTAAGFKFKLNDEELVYEYTKDGDGRVTAGSARVRGVRAWRLDAEHGELTRTKKAFTAYVELLSTGTTTHLESFDRPDSRRDNATGTQAPHASLRPSHKLSSPQLPRSLTAVDDALPSEKLEEERVPHALEVKVEHGNLKFVEWPLLVGHYHALGLSGSEAVVDSLLNGRMSHALRADLYPEGAGSCHIFDNDFPTAPSKHRRPIPRPKAVVVVGLGEEGKLRTAELSYSVRLGVLAYAQHLSERNGHGASFDIATTLIGSGGTGISVGNAALSIVQGVIDANLKLKEENKWPFVRLLTFVELYLDRATDAWRVLKMQSQATPERLRVEDVVLAGEGRLRRPLDSSYRGATYDFISVLQAKGSDPQHPEIAFRLDSKRARTEVRAQQAQGGLVRDLVAKASNQANGYQQIGRTLFHLLVPVEIEPYLAGLSDMVIELDRSTAALPWELLDTEAGVKSVGTDGTVLPWAIRSKLIRKLQVEQFRTQVVDATAEDNVLIIGEPQCDSQYGRLPGARSEAHAVQKIAVGNSGGVAGEKVRLLAEQNNAETILNALYDGSYRAIHIAGHGVGGKRGGVVLSGDHAVLGADEIRAMRISPELVFLNCCHLAQREAGTALKEYDRVSFAANVAEELIRAGVRCVIAAGWAVEDGAAARFATTFYSALFGGARFIDAVGRARKAAWEANGSDNTWAAFQCYGDPEWSWRRDTTAPLPSPEEEYGGISCATSLSLVLEGFATEFDYTPTADLLRNRARLDYLEANFGTRWGNQGAVAEVFAKSFAAVDDREKARTWFERAILSADGGATLTAMEGYAVQLSMPGSTEEDFTKAIRMLRRLIHIAPSLKRHSIMAIAQKRLSMIYDDLKKFDLARIALKHAEVHFELALRAASEEEKKYLHYPARGKVACALRKSLVDTPNGQLRIAEAEREALERVVETAARQSASFWSIVAQSELAILLALPGKELSRVKSDLFASLADLYNRISAPRFWIFVHDDTRFLLDPYKEALPQGHAERVAAEDILGKLRDYSGQ